MSVRAGLVFENNAEGTQKRTIIHLGWVSPSDYALTGLIINAEKEIDRSYEWDTLVYFDKKMTREKFEEMKKCYTLADLSPRELRRKVMRQWTLEKAFSECK